MLLKTYAADSPKRKYDLYFKLNPNWSPRTGGTSVERAAYTCPIVNAQAIKNIYDYIYLRLRVLNRAR